MRELPSGRVTLVFTDIEGSTRLLHELGVDAYANILAEHRRVLREAFARNGGVEVDTQGDAFFIAFGDAHEALAAAREAQASLAGGPVRVRMGVHTGSPRRTAEGYVGIDVHRGARICAAGHGGQILVSQATRDEVGADAGLSDLGEHRLKDLAEPEWLFQVGGGHFPPLKSISNTNLPAEATALVGRTRQVDDIVALVRGARLVTLTGPGGSGKTRLALRVAAELVEEFPNGVFLVDLAPVRDAALVIPTVALTLGVAEQPASTPAQALVTHLQGRRTLLVLDNLEHVLGAAGELGAVLGAAGDVVALATSRERLALAAEHEYPVPPLATEEAVELFTRRAAAARPGLAVDGPDVAAICARLDNLPLAVELAAARIRLFSLEALLARLDQRLPLLTGGGRDTPERQRTLRGAIEWSYDLLEPDEQALFARLGVFAGGWTIDAADAVAGAGLDALSSLVDKSLVRQDAPAGEARFALLETIREYAVDRLRASGEEHELRARHAAYFHELAEQTRLDLFGPEQVPALRRMRLEVDNLRAALAFARHEADGRLELQLAGALVTFWLLAGLLTEARDALEHAVRRVRDRSPDWGRAAGGLAFIAVRQGDLETAERYAREELELAEELSDAEGLPSATSDLANVLAARGQYEEAVSLFERSVRYAREAGDEPRMAIALHNLGETLLEAGDPAAAERAYAEALAHFRALRNVAGESDSLAGLGLVELRRHGPGAAKPLLLEAVELRRELGLEAGALAAQLVALAACEAAAGHGERVGVLVGAADALAATSGAALDPLARRLRESALATAGIAAGPEDLAQARDRGARLTPDAAVAYALGEAVS